MKELIYRTRTLLIDREMHPNLVGNSIQDPAANKRVGVLPNLLWDRRSEKFEPDGRDGE